MYAIRDLLDFLESEDRKTIDRLCALRGVEQWRRVEKCKTLARSYQGNHAQLFQDLEKRDLVALLTDPTEVEGELYVLPDAERFTKRQLVDFALATFREERVAPGLVRVEDDEDDDHDDDAPAEPAEDFAFDAALARAPARPYQRELVEALQRAVVGAKAGKRLRITVATGGGKTRIANDWIWEHALPAKLRVLWVTKDWSLLNQAAADLCRRRRGAARRLGFVGAKGPVKLAGLAERANAEVVYTTIHTWRRRKDTSFDGSSFDAVIIDESHWGEGKAAYRDLYKRYRPTAVFVGLTATPREGTGYTLVGREYDYATLEGMGVLAHPIVEPTVRTGVAWAPQRSGAHGDFDRASLSKLARSKRRNTTIVDTYWTRRNEFGKTLVFACDIEHASALTASLQARSVAAECVHSAMSLADQAEAVRRFKNGTTRVLVNVAMMTHGIDIPDIETVFLARPTVSKILFAQMVGRAVRKTETKTHFRLVDFVDSLAEHGDLLVSPSKYFGAVVTASRATATYRRSPARSRHEYARARFVHVPQLAGFEEIAGLDIQPDQTFGIEFELTRDDFEQGTLPADWMDVAKALLEAIPAPRARKPFAEYHHADKSHDVWNVEWDGSCGWEVTSRILSGHEGFCEVVDVCRALELVKAELGLKLTKKTGTHVHLAWKPKLSVLRHLMRLVAQYEPALYTVVAPSRSGNDYCRPVRRHLRELLALPSLSAWGRHFEDHDKRYLAVNPSNLFGDLNTLEVRLHSGTIEGPKILGWLSLWMRLLDASERSVALPEEKLLYRDLPLTTGPQGDITELAELVKANRELVTHLRGRRDAVMGFWFEDPKHGERARAVASTWT